MMILIGDAATDPAQAGGKGANLARLTAAGFDVPAFFVVPDAGFDGAVLRDVELVSAAQALGPGPYAVRSSGRQEDGAEHSHAGQFDTLLNVSIDGLAEAVTQVRRSGLGERVETYRAERGLTGADLPAVVVQQMVPARLSGVAFSADPIKGLRGVAVISATTGLGEALVSGEVDGETWAVTEDVITAPDTPNMTPAEAREVAALARAAEAAFGAPQDIEWAYDGAHLYMLQSRAITTDLRPAPIPDTALAVLDNSNIIESYPGLVSPLTYSFAAYAYDRVYRGFVALLGLPQRQIADNAPVFANLLARVDGRVYYNLGNWYRALALLPGFSLNRDFMETMMGLSSPLPAETTEALAPPESRGLARVTEAFRVGWVVLGLLRAALRLPRTKARFMDRLDTALAAGQSIDAMPLTDLAAHYRRIESALLDRWDAPLVNDFLCMMAFGASRRMLEVWAGDAGLTFHNALMIGQGNIVSAEPARRIAAMGAIARDQGAEVALATGDLAGFPDLQAEVQAYLAKFGDRCTQELKLESIPLTDDPAPLLAAIQAAAARGLTGPKQETPPDWPALLPQAGRRAIAQRLCAYAAARVRDRENLRFERTRIFGHARQVFLAMGAQFHALGHLDDPRDIFLLTVDEVLGAIEGAALSPDLAALVALRRAEMQAAATRPDPPERLTLRGPAMVPRAQAVPPEAATGDRRQGTGCSTGVVEGMARVIRDPRIEHLEAGEILVAPSTDPGWISVFVNASAIVVERGSLLSHSAIVARELGIPCVVGIGDATRWLASGTRISVDGGSGEVRKRDD